MDPVFKNTGYAKNEWSVHLVQSQKKENSCRVLLPEEVLLEQLSDLMYLRYREDLHDFQLHTYVYEKDLEVDVSYTVKGDQKTVFFLRLYVMKEDHTSFLFEIASGMKEEKGFLVSNGHIDVKIYNHIGKEFERSIVGIKKALENNYRESKETRLCALLHQLRFFLGKNLTEMLFHLF